MVARRKQSVRKKPLYTKSTAMDVDLSSTSASADQTSTSQQQPPSSSESLQDIHRLMIEKAPEFIPIASATSSEAPQSVPVPSVPHPSPVVTRLPFDSYVVSRHPFNTTSAPGPFNLGSPLSPGFTFKIAQSSRSPKLKLNDTIDLSQDSPAPIIDLEPDDTEVEEGEITDTTLPLVDPNPPPPVPANPNVPITEIILGSDDEDDIEVVGIVSPGSSSMAGGGRARGAINLGLTRSNQKSLRRARAIARSNGSRIGTPLGVQQATNLVRSATRGSTVKSRRIEKMNRMRGQTRWGTPLPITKKHRKSLRIAAKMVVQAAAANNRNLSNMAKDTPFMRRLENINPTHRGLIKQKQRYFNQLQGNLNIRGPGQSNLPGRDQPLILRNPVVRNVNPFHPQQRLLPTPPPVRRNPLGSPRPIVIDGSNVAVGHGGPSKVFSCRGLEIMVQKIKLELPHKEIVVFVPRFRAKLSESRDTYILDNLEKEGILKYTPSRDVGNKRISSYDDRFIVEYAVKTGGIIVSNDNFRDLYQDEPEWRDTISNRLLQFTWVNDLLMFPADPLGKAGPKLDEFLCFPVQATMNY